MKKQLSIILITLLPFLSMCQDTKNQKRASKMRSGKMMQQNMNDPDAINPAKNNSAVRYKSGNMDRRSEQSKQADRKGNRDLGNSYKNNRYQSDTTSKRTKSK